MRLSQFSKYEEVVIQCHDNPDPDTIAAGYGLYKYFKSKDKNVRLIYSGSLKITKSNILLFVKELNIPLEYVEIIKTPELLITVDCQYGAGNVRKFEANTIAVIDHHHQEIKKDIDYIDIRNFLASASTMVWQLLIEEGFELDESLQTALYYGLLTDSNSFTEIIHPLDKDMHDTLQFDKELIQRLKNSILSLRELEIAGMALIRHSYNTANKFAIVKAQACDPNILGFISDLILQVDSVLVCLVYNEIVDGIKFSVRSCTREVRANELAAYLTKGLGSGGGHTDKAGGLLQSTYFNKNYNNINADEYFLTRLTAYYQSFEVLDTKYNTVNLEDMKYYKKKKMEVGAVKLENVLPIDTPIIIRTLHGDMEIKVKKGQYLVINSRGRASLIEGMRFIQNHKLIGDHYTVDVEYYPSLRNKVSGEIIPLGAYTKKFLFKGEEYVYAKQLDKSLKLFGAWNRQDYMYGKQTDYMVVNQEDLTDVYIVSQESFASEYEKVEK